MIEIVIRQLSGSWLDGECSFPPPAKTGKHAKKKKKKSQSQQGFLGREIILQTVWVA